MKVKAIIPLISNEHVNSPMYLIDSLALGIDLELLASIGRNHYENSHSNKYDNNSVRNN
jgi:hypothetical protein